MNEQQLIERIEQISPKLKRLAEGLNQVLLGKEALVNDLVTGILAGGHVLLEGLPGIGKTEMVKGLGRLCSVHSNRVQFTPDLLPSDITGSYILSQDGQERKFLFQPGPVFSNILLGDEINRASPKTQSALLQAMAEHAVTVMGETHSLPRPFFVIATQNPIELEGTYPLPEAQLDRFLFKLHLTRPADSVLSDIVRNRVYGRPPELAPVLSAEELNEAIDLASMVFVSEAVAGYISRLVEASHPDSPLAPELVRKYVRYGASPRAAIALGASARARALMLGRPHAGFDSVRELFWSVMNHRILLDYSARLDGIGVREVVDSIVGHIDEYSKPLPAGVKA